VGIITNDPFSRPQAVLNAARRIRLGVERRSTSDFYNGVRDFAGCLNQAEKSSFGLFHAFISVFEFAVTYVLCVASPHKAIVLPWSWAMLHLPRIMQSHAKSQLTSKEIRTHMSALNIINATFSTLHQQINVYLDNGILRFQGFGRAYRSAGAMIVINKRRSTELLSTIILNTDTWPNQASEYRDMRTLTHSTLRSNMPQGMSLDLYDKDKFRLSCIRAYEPYNDKDGLCVITLNDEVTPRPLRPFIDGKAMFSTLSEIVTLANLASTPGPTRPGEAQQGEEYTESELNVIVDVQKRWRKVMKAYPINRRYLQTPAGQYTVQLVEVCNRVFASGVVAFWPIQQKLIMRKVIFMDLFNLIMALDGVLGHLRELQNKWRQEFNNNHSIAQVEELTLIRDKIVSLVENLETVRCDWALQRIQHTVLSTAPDKVSASARGAYRAIMLADEEIQETLIRVEVVADSSL
jgi:hypothetical protein